MIRRDLKFALGGVPRCQQGGGAGLYNRAVLSLGRLAVVWIVLSNEALPTHLFHPPQHVATARISSG